MAKQDFDAKKAAYDIDVASVPQAVAQVNQAKAQTESPAATSTAGSHAPRQQECARPDPGHRSV